MPRYSPSDQYPDHPVLYNVCENQDTWNNFKKQHATFTGSRLQWLHASLPLVNAIDVRNSSNEIRFKSEKDVTYFILKYS